jgi:hypothetical protein
MGDSTVFDAAEERRSSHVVVHQVLRQSLWLLRQGSIDEMPTVGEHGNGNYDQSHTSVVGRADSSHGFGALPYTNYNNLVG